MNGRRYVIIMIIAASAVLAAGCSRKGQQRLVRIGVTHGPSHSFTLALERFGRNLQEQTGGRYRVKVYYGSQLGGEKELQEMLTIGTVEMTVSGIINTYEPLFAVFELPYLYRDRRHVMAVNNGPIMKDCAEALLPKGLRLIGFYENGFRHITNSVRPINSPDDVKGLKLRTPENPAQIETFRALGAIPAPMSFSELYSALVQGVIDGQENPLQNIWYAHLYEAQKHLAMTGHIYNCAYVLISERFWQLLPEADREIFKSCMEESTKWQLEYAERMDAELEEKLKGKGVEITYPDREEFRRVCQPVYEVIYGKLGPRAREIVNKILQSQEVIGDEQK